MNPNKDFVNLLFEKLTHLKQNSPMVQGFLKKRKAKEKEKKEEEEYSFFINAFLIRRGIELGQCVVATKTKSCDVLNEEFQLDPKMERFMIEKVVAILDKSHESLHNATLEVFYNKFLFYTSNITFLTSFVCIENVNSTIFNFAKISKAFTN